MTSPWYRYGDQPPPRIVKVRVLWDGREFVAARALDEKTGKEFWGEYKLKANGKLSADATPVGLRGAPELWRPLYAELWKGRLPAPVTLSEAGRMHSERMAFTATEMAEEMERDRANVSREADTRREPLQWWRDASQIKYEVAPNFTLRMVEGRLMRAVYNCGAATHSKIQTSPLLRELSAAVVRELAMLAEKEAKDRAEGNVDIVPRMKATGADDDDEPIALGWFVALHRPRDPYSPIKRRGGYKFNRAQEVILRRAKNIPNSYDEIGMDINISRKRVEQIFNRAIEDCWRLAMGMPARPGAAPRRDLMAELRERNRRAKREARG